MFVPDLEKWTANLISVTVPLFLYIWTNKRKAKKEQDRRHADIAAERKFFPAHRHDEKHGPLLAEGITPAPKVNGQI